MYFITKDKSWEGNGETSSCPKAVIADLFIYNICIYFYFYRTLHSVSNPPPALFIFGNQHIHQILNLFIFSQIIGCQYVIPPA